MRVAAVFLALLVAGCATDQAHVPCSVPPANFTEELALRTLRQAPRVWPDGWGIAGAPSCYAAAFRFLLVAPNSRNAFERLAKTGTPAGKLYGLAGLREISPQHFEEYASDRFFNSDVRVEVIYGCVVQEQSISDFVARIRAGNLGEFSGAV